MISDKEFNRFLKRINVVKKRRLNKIDAQRIWSILQLLEPDDGWNDQKCWTEVYFYNNKEYHVHRIIGRKPIVEVLEDI